MSDDDPSDGRGGRDSVGGEVKQVFRYSPGVPEHHGLVAGCRNWSIAQHCGTARPSRPVQAHTNNAWPGGQVTCGGVWAQPTVRVGKSARIDNMNTNLCRMDSSAPFRCKRMPPRFYWLQRSESRFRIAGDQSNFSDCKLGLHGKVSIESGSEHLQHRKNFRVFQRTPAISCC
jgi:hypothetical protein